MHNINRYSIQVKPNMHMHSYKIHSTMRRNKKKRFINRAIENSNALNQQNIMISTKSIRLGNDHRHIQMLTKKSQKAAEKLREQGLKLTIAFVTNESDIESVQLHSKALQSRY